MKNLSIYEKLNPNSTYLFWTKIQKKSDFNYTQANEAKQK